MVMYYSVAGMVANKIVGHPALACEIVMLHDLMKKE